MTVVAEGMNVIQVDKRPTGPIKFLKDPTAVIAFITSGEIEDHIVMAQGGTTTFLAPILSQGCIGIVTMSGAPESHLGILSREFQVPCIMTAHLTGGSGSRYVPGETGPEHFTEIVEALDGKVVTLDVSDPETGRIELAD